MCSWYTLLYAYLPNMIFEKCDTVVVIYKKKRGDNKF